MNNQNLYLIADIPGYTSQIARLVSMLNYARHMTLSAVKDLTISELDYLPNETGNSIGALLLHLAATEVGYQAATFENRQLNEAEKQEWGAVFSLGEQARAEIKGHALDYYLNKLEEVRAKTLAELATRDDRWLDEEATFGDNRINNYFKWFHVLTHEVNHRGQIKLVCRQAKQVGNITVQESDVINATPKVTGIGGVFFKAQQPDQLREWYGTHLGFVTDQYGSLFEFRLADNPDQKGYLQWTTFSETSTYFDPSPKPFMINYRVQNLEALVAELKQNSVTVLDDIETFDYGKFVHILDPENNKIELWEPVDEVFTESQGDETTK